MQKSEYAQLSHSLMQYIDQSSPKNIDVSTQDAQKRLSDLVARLHTP
ncbi:hypothetical protein GW750_04095 [bacterium]|nr:hypothetical protein [bacterium]